MPFLCRSISLVGVIVVVFRELINLLFPQDWGFSQPKGPKGIKDLKDLKDLQNKFQCPPMVGVKEPKGSKKDPLRKGEL